MNQGNESYNYPHFNKVTDWSGATVEIINSNGEVIGSTTANSDGTYTVSVAPGSNYLARISKGNLVLKAIIDSVSSAKTVNVNPMSTAIVKVIARLIGNTNLGEKGGNVTSQIANRNISNDISSIRAHTSFTSIVTAISQEIESSYDPNAATAAIGAVSVAGNTEMTIITTAITSGTTTVTTTTAGTTTTSTTTTDTTSTTGTTSDTTTTPVITGKTVSGSAKVFYSGSALSDIQVTLGGTYSATTDASGNWSVSGVADGDYEITFKDIHGVYETYKPRILRVNAQKESQGKLSNLEAKLFLRADRNFLNYVLRGDGTGYQQSANGLEKWVNYTPVWDVYTLNFNGDGRVQQTLIDGVKNALKNEIAQFYKKSITDSDINVIESLVPVGQPANGHVQIYWNDNMLGASNNSWYNRSEVISAYSAFTTSHGKYTWLQELGENLIGGGETQDASYSDSIFYDGAGSQNPVTLSAKDLLVSEAVYGASARKLGNKDLSGTYGDDWHDADPDGSVWNE